MMGRTLSLSLSLSLAWATAPASGWAAESASPGGLAVAPPAETSPAPPAVESTPPTAADDDPWTFAVGSRHRVVRDPAFDVFSEDDALRGFDMSVVRAVAEGVSVGLSWQTGSATESDVLGEYRFSFLHHAASVVALYESVAVGRLLVGGDWLRPTARAEVGVVLGRASVELDSPNGGAGEERLQWVAVPVAHGGVGVRIFPFAGARALTAAEAAKGPAGEGYRFAVEAEVGWSLLTPMNFDALEAEGDPPSSAIDSGAVDEGAPAITRHALDLGELTLEGAEFRVGALMRF